MAKVDDLSEIETAGRYDGLSHPTPTNLKKSAVFALAEKVAKAWSAEKGKDLFQLVEGIGGEIVFIDAWGEELTRSESLHVDSNGKFKIMLPTYTSIARDNFTIAHELGHYVLHYLWPSVGKSNQRKEFVAFRSGSSQADQKCEWEANWFAAAFLMPEADFKKDFLESNGSLQLVALRFGVTAKAAQIRALSLGIQKEKVR